MLPRHHEAASRAAWLGWISTETTGSMIPVNIVKPYRPKKFKYLQFILLEHNVYVGSPMVCDLI
jgi:hypothetical protein